MTVWLFPGQGSQGRGMGAALFERFPAELAQADEVLGYSLRELCLNDPDGLLDRTDHTQPALFAVAALECLARRAAGSPEPAAVAGHSLGEYAALFAAGVFDFATGLRLVKERGRLMNEARDGSMVAIVGADADALRHLLAERGHTGVDVANYNAPMQIVLAGPRPALDAAARDCESAGYMVFPLKVSAAFHSRQMEPAQRAFAGFIAQFDFAAPRMPVIANATASPYPADAAGVRERMVRQLTEPVRWVDSMHYLMARGHEDFEELGPGIVLSKLIAQIRKLPVPPLAAAEVADMTPEPTVAVAAQIAPLRPAPAQADEDRPASRVTAEQLGSEAFRRAHGVRYAYYAGAMYKAIASPELVVAMGRAGMLGFLGTGGVPLQRSRESMAFIRDALGEEGAWGVNLLSTPDDPDGEMAVVEACLAQGVRVVEASAFVSLSPSVVRFRYVGARRLDDGRAEAARRVIAKVSRAEVAGQFMLPAPTAIVDELLARGLLSEEEAWCAGRLPVADDLCVESDSGGHTDGGSPFAALPAIIAQRDRLASQGASTLRVGAAGGIGTPSAVVAALMLGADFVCTGSINQCTVEAGTSEAVKDVLQELGLNDFAYAPAGDMFELGAQVQVVRKGLFFPARARRLYDLYRHYESLDEIPAEVRRQLEERFFGRSIDAVWGETRAWLQGVDPDMVARAEASPKYRMALVFRWYFHYTTELALEGRLEHKVNFQIHSGPALGAFNAWAQGTGLESWRNRHVADIGRRLLDDAAALLDARLRQFIPKVSNVA